MQNSLSTLFFFFPCRARDQIQGLMHATQVLYTEQHPQPPVEFYPNTWIQLKQIKSCSLTKKNPCILNFKT